MPDEPTLWELQRAIESGQREVRDDIAHLHARLDHFVLKEVYEAHRAGDLERIKRLEDQQAISREATRRALLTAISSFVAPIIVAVVLALVLGGGGP